MSGMPENSGSLLALFRNSPDAIYVLDLDGRFVSVNPASEKISGYTAEELSAMSSFRELIVPDEIPRVEVYFGKTLSGESQQFETAITRKSGEVVAINVSTVPNVVDGKVVGVYGIARNLSEREMIQSRLFDLSLDFICIAGSDGYFKKINPTFEKVLGYTEQELLGKPLTEFIHPDDRERTIAEVSEQLKGKTTISFENRYVCRDGTVKTLLWNAFAVPEEGLLYAIGHDITERKRAEEELAEKTAYLDNILHSSTELAIAATDLDLKIVYYNPVAERLFGYRADEVIGHTVMEIHTKETVEPERFERAVETVKREGQYRYSVEQEKNGAVCYIDSKVSGIWNRNGELIGFVLMSVDVTKSRLAENSLRESEERYRSLTHTASDAIISSDSDGNIISWNRGARTIFGYDEIEALGRSVTALMPARFVALHLDGMKRLQTTGTHRIIGKTVEYAGLRKDGTEFPLELNLASYQTEKGTFYSAIIRDTSERRKIEADLEREQLQSHAIVTTVGEGIISIGTDSHIRFVNQELCNIFGYAEGELTGRHLELLMPEKYRRAHSDGMKKYLEYGIPTILGRRLELEGVRRDGTVIPIEFRVEETFISESGERFFTAAIRDISERRSAEDALKKLKNAIEQTAEMVVITDRNGMIEYVNPSFEKITEYPKEEVIGRNPRVLKSGRHDNVFYRQMWDAILAGKIWNGSLVNRKKSGELYDEMMTISPVFDRAGSITHFVAIKRDISEEKRLQHQLMHAEKLSSIGTFVSGVAHELNNPLSGILGYAELLRDNEGFSDQVCDDLAKIQVQAERAAKIVRNLLKFSSRYKQGKTSVDINDLIENTISLQEYQFQTKNIAIERRYAENLPPVAVDANELQQVFMNILVNAYHSMVSAGVKGAVTVVTADRGDHIEIAMENNGPSIPEDKLDRIFDPFFTTKEIGEGTGLGLYVSYGILKEHGGDITAENIGNDGVRFLVTLPKTGTATPQPAEETVAPPLPPDIRILVVEDEGAIAEWLKRLMEKHRAHVSVASNGKEATEFLSANDVDIILTDVKMPVMSGLELAEWLKREKPSYMERIIIFTGAIDAEIRDFCTVNHCSYLLKPLQGKMILEAVNDMLKKR